MAYHPFRHLGLKLFAVALSVVLWLIVSGDRVVERNLQVPLEFENIPEGIELVGTPPDSADIRVRGPSVALSRISPGDVMVVLDLTSARSGTRLFHVLADDVRTPFGVEVVQIAPTTLSLDFERSGSRVVPVVPAIDGDPAPGFVVTKVTATPPTVEVLGPETRLNELESATTDVVGIDGVSRSLEEEVTIGVIDTALRLRVPSKARVTVDIRPAPLERAVHDVRVAPRNVGEDRTVQVTPSTVTVYVRGSREVLGNLAESSLTAFVNLASLGPGRYNLVIEVEPSSDFAVVRTEPEMVEVRIR